jgi:hypothetical protein
MRLVLLLLLLLFWFTILTLHPTTQSCSTQVHEDSSAVGRPNIKNSSLLEHQETMVSLT